MHPYAPIQYTNTLMNTLSYPYTYTHYSPTGLILEYLLLEWKFYYYLLLFNNPTVLLDLLVFTITLLGL